MRTVDDAPSLIDRLLRRSSQHSRVEPTDALARPRTGSLPVTETIDLFVAIAAAVPEIVAIRARSQGERVHFMVESSGIWHQTIDKLEPRLVELELELGGAFDYSVVRPGLEADPPGYLDVFLRD